MKKKLGVLCLVFAGTVVNGQDLVRKTNGEEIEVKVLEVTSDVVKFKKISNIDGPLFSFDKSEIEEIVFENGDIEIFTLQRRIRL